MAKIFRSLCLIVSLALLLSLAGILLPAVMAQAQLTEVWVDDDFDESTTGWGVDHFDNIQDGIDAVVGSTVHVADGTYDGFVISAKDDIEILAEDGAVVTGYGTSGESVYYTYAVMALVSDSDNFTIDGLDFDGSGLTEDFQLVEGICCLNSIGNITNVDISNVYGTYTGMGICVYRFPEPNLTVNISGTTVTGSPIGILAQNDTVTIDECVVTGVEDYVGILAIDGANLNVSSSGVNGFYYGVMVGANSAYEEAMEIEDEDPCQARICCCRPDGGNDYDISDNYYGIYIDEDGQATVCGNTIADNGHGIWIDSDGNVIKGNDILNNDAAEDSGVHLSSNAYNNVINYNNIVGNSTYYGVYQEPIDGDVDAEYNWWNDDDGPGGAGPGDGDTVNEYYVDYDPWLCLPYGQVETATGTGIASFSCCNGAIEELEAVDEDDLPANGDKPDLEFPHGFFSFKITELEDGATVTVTITLPEDVPEGTEWWKYDSELGWSSIDIGDDDGDNVITITLTDGGTGDQDGTENGEILEPGGPGIPEEEECETPTAHISASALMGEAPLTIQLRGYSDQSDVEYRWSFGTGDSSYSRSPSYTFNNEGTYTVILIVTNECGESARDSVTINVEAQNLPPVLVVRDLNISPAYAKYGEPVYITATVFNEGGSWGSQDMQLLINGQFEQSAPVGLAAGTSQTINFTVYKTEARQYQVAIGDATGTFYVMEEAAQPTQKTGLLAGGELDTGGIIAIICIAVILVGGVVVVFLLAVRH